MHQSVFHRGRFCAPAPAAILLLALCLVALGVVSVPVAAVDSGAPAIEWQRCLGGTSSDTANAVQQTADGGYIVAGAVYSNDGDASGYHGGIDQYGNHLPDAWVVKLDAAGSPVWQRCLGGTGDDVANAVQQTADGGYIVAGHSGLSGGDVAGNHGLWDAWVVKLNATGAVIWQKSLGGSNYDEARAVKQTADGGYIVAGNTQSTDGDAAGNHGNNDAWVAKLTPTGALAWQRCLGGTGNDAVASVNPTADGGYILSATTDSTDGDVAGNHGWEDIWVVKLNATGDLVWQRCLGGTSRDEAGDLRPTADGGYIVAGDAWSTDGDVTGNHGGNGDVWVARLTASGGLVWQTCLGGTGQDNPHAVQQTADGGYIMAGTTASSNGDVSGIHGGYGFIPNDVWVVRLDPAGGLVWQKCLGGTSSEWGNAVQQTNDGGYVVAGNALSHDGDVSGAHGDSTDAWVVKLGALPAPPTTKPPVVAPPAAGYETPVVVRDDDQVAPVNHGPDVVWEDWRNNAEGRYDWDVYSYNLTSHLERPVHATSSDVSILTADDSDAVISGAGIFWVESGSSDADVNNAIDGQTLAGDHVNVTLVGEPGQRVINDLAIDGTRLVYVLSNVGGDYRVILYDTATRYVFTIRESPNEIRSPDISGDTIVWLEYNGSSWDMYRYNLLQGTAREFATSVGDRASLAIDGTHLVWSRESDGDYDLYSWDLSQPYPSGDAWLDAPGDQVNPAISGDRVVWQDDRDGDWDIYTRNLSGGAVSTVCTAPGDQESPAIDGDRIVWQDKRNGNWDVYLFTVSSTGPVPAPTPARLVITSPGTYSIAADGYDGIATPIEIRSSNVVLDGGGHTIDGARRAGTSGILIDGAGTLSNVVVRNVRLVNWETGIQADGVIGGVIEGSEIAYNRQGIALRNGQEIVIRNNAIRANDRTGIVVGDSQNATIRANKIVHTGEGFVHYLYSTMDLFTHAVAVSGSTGTIIAGNDLSGDHGSLRLENSVGTRVTGNQIAGRICGIMSLSSAGDAVVFDNVVRNVHAVYGSPANTVWNTTPSPGPNVVGGPQIGGNFWAKPDGTGFSETHPDANGDGFIDTPFVNGDYGGGTDYLPLAPWTGPKLVALPGGSGLPTSTVGNGLYDDVNGNGRKDFADVVLYFNQMTWIAANEPLSAFDYNGNGRIDFADVVWLFNRL